MSHPVSPHVLSSQGQLHDAQKYLRYYISPGVSTHAISLSDRRMVHGDIVPDNVLLLAPFQTSLRVEPWQELKLQVWTKCVGCNNTSFCAHPACCENAGCQMKA